MWTSKVAFQFENCHYYAEMIHRQQKTIECYNSCMLSKDTFKSDPNCWLKWHNYQGTMHYVTFVFLC